LDARVCRITEIFVTRHADIDARNSGAGALFDALMTIRAFDSDIDGMDFMRKIDRLLRLGLDAKEMSGGVAEAGMCRRKCRRTPAFLHIGIVGPCRIPGGLRLLHAAESDAP